MLVLNRRETDTTLKKVTFENVKNDSVEQKM